jgi:hypothetical protein
MRPDPSSNDQRAADGLGSAATMIVRAPVRRHNAQMHLDYATFKASLTAASPPEQTPPLLAALWHAGKGDWARAHEIAQDDESESGSWVHAYLHRVEGDESNAGYWYRRAKKPHATSPLAAEWEEIARALLAGC